MTVPLASPVPVRREPEDGRPSSTRPDPGAEPGAAPRSMLGVMSTPMTTIHRDGTTTTGRQPVRVLILARSPAVRAGLAALLSTDDAIQIAQPPVIAGGWLRPGDGAPTRTEAALPPDVVVIDRDSLGADAVDTATERHSGTPMVLLGGDETAPIRLGECPVAYLGPDADGLSLVASVHAVMAGLTVIEPAMAVRLGGTGPVAPTLEPGEALTPREQEVLRLVAEGLPNKSIARELGISEHTAKFHVGSLLAKLNAGSRTEAVMTATRRGLLTV